MGHREEILKIIDIVRADKRRSFEKDPMSKMSIEQMLVEIRKNGLYLTNVYEGTDGIYRCHLRYHKNKMAGETGLGQTMGEAIWQAYEATKRGGFENRDKPAKTMSEKIEEAPKGVDFSKLPRPKPKPPVAKPVVVDDDDLLGEDNSDVDLLGEDEDSLL